MKFKGIIIHHTDSEHGTILDVNEWHNERGFDGVGYHALVPNGWINADEFIELMNGSLEIGRDWSLEGAHALGYNDYFGLAMTGKDKFSDKQFNMVLAFCKWLIKRDDFDISEIKGHNECEGVTKSCPNWDVQELRDLLSADKEVWFG